MAVVARSVRAALTRHNRRPHVLASCSQQRLVSSTLQEAVAPPLVLLLDLDETLLRPKLQRVHKSRTLSTVDFRILIDGSVECQGSLRPGLKEFLEWICKRRESGHISGPWIFGQGAKSYIKPVMRQLDPKKTIFGSRVLAKDKCTPLKPPWPWVLKSFAKIPCEGGESSEANAQRCVLVDNNVMSCILHPENTLLVRDWQADGADDNELARVSSTLDAVIAADAAEGASGNYGHQLAKITPRFDEFRERLAAIHARMKEAPDPDRPAKEVLIETWKEACDAKRMLLELGPNEN